MVIFHSYVSLPEGKSPVFGGKISCDQCCNHQSVYLIARFKGIHGIHFWLSKSAANILKTKMKR
jgi:hypothetical protein